MDFRLKGHSPQGKWSEMADARQTNKASEIESPEFIERLKAHDKEAFHILIEAFETRIYNLGLRLTRTPEEAEEVLQDTLLAIFNKIHTFKGNSLLSTWIYAIASNNALGLLRKKREIPVTLEEEISLKKDRALLRNSKLLFTIPPEENPLEKKELAERLEKAIDELPHGYREIFILKELNNLPVKEVANIVGIKPGAVKTRLHRARLILRASLSDIWEAEQK